MGNEQSILKAIKKASKERSIEFVWREPFSEGQTTIEAWPELENIILTSNWLTQSNNIFLNLFNNDLDVSIFCIPIHLIMSFKIFQKFSLFLVFNFYQN